MHEIKRELQSQHNPRQPERNDRVLERWRHGDVKEEEQDADDDGNIEFVTLLYAFKMASRKVKYKREKHPKQHNSVPSSKNMFLWFFVQIAPALLFQKRKQL